MQPEYFAPPMHHRACSFSLGICKACLLAVQGSMNNVCSSSYAAPDLGRERLWQPATPFRHTDIIAGASPGAMPAQPSQEARVNAPAQACCMSMLCLSVEKHMKQGSQHTIPSPYFSPHQPSKPACLRLFGCRRLGRGMCKISGGQC